MPDTQLTLAREGKISPAMEAVAQDEHTTPEIIRQRIADGTVVIPKNRLRSNTRPCGVGLGLRTKVNANIGSSSDYADVEIELRKLRAAEEAGADSVMDLSTGGDLEAIRRTLIASTNMVVGTVPIYDAAVTAARETGSIRGMTADSIMAAVERHAAAGVDFVTVHCGVTRAVVETLKKTPRVVGIVSRGGEFIANWIRTNRLENPLYEQFDRVLAICREYDVTLSLGDGLRPGCLADALDPAQSHELMILGELAQCARDAGVQVMIEGPGHVPLDQITTHIKMQKELCKGAPFYVLGPLVTDIAPGYDHITSAIGGAIAASAGADFLCYVTPTEHLSLPSEEHVRMGVIAARIAAHAADIAKHVPGAREQDRSFSIMRKNRDWEGQLANCIDPIMARKYREEGKPNNEEVCSMCGEFCVFKIAEDAPEAC